MKCEKSSHIPNLYVGYGHMVFFKLFLGMVRLDSCWRVLLKLERENVVQEFQKNKRKIRTGI
jgi:hypothetical protein